MPAATAPFTRVADVAGLGAAIRRRRRELGLTQEQIASVAGVGMRFVSELERGKPTVQLGKLLQVTRRLGIDLWVAPRSGS